MIHQILFIIFWDQIARTFLAITFCMEKVGTENFRK